MLLLMILVPNRKVTNRCFEMVRFKVGDSILTCCSYSFKVWFTLKENVENTKGLFLSCFHIRPVRTNPNGLFTPDESKSQKPKKIREQAKKIKEKMTNIEEKIHFGFRFHSVWTGLKTWWDCSVAWKGGMEVSFVQVVGSDLRWRIRLHLPGRFSVLLHVFCPIMLIGVDPARGVTRAMGPGMVCRRRPCLAQPCFPGVTCQDLPNGNYRSVHHQRAPGYIPASPQKVHLWTVFSRPSLFHKFSCQKCSICVGVL